MFLPVFALYSAVALAMFYPLVAKISTDVPADLRDPFLNSWILWWNAHHIPLTREWWNAPAFYPISGVLAFSEHLFGLTLLTTPVQWLGGSPVLAYNLAFLLSFPLSALAAHGLCYSVTRRHDAALLAGLSFAFNPYKVAQLSHLQVLSSFWMPLSLWGLTRSCARRSCVSSCCLPLRGSCKGCRMVTICCFCPFCSARGFSGSCRRGLIGGVWLWCSPSGAASRCSCGHLPQAITPFTTSSGCGDPSARSPRRVRT